MGYVYKITNTINGKAYIGFSVNEPEKRRIKDHLSGRGNELLAKAVKKYGRDAFTYEVLEANVFDEFLPELEVAYIAKHNTVVPHGYNLTYGGEGGGIPSEETRRKLSKASKGRKLPPRSAEHRRKISEAKKGKKLKPLTEEHRRKISEAQKGEKNHQFGKSHSKETRRKMSEAMKGENHPQFGKPHSAETRCKISNSLKGEKNPQFGKVRTVEHRRKLSEAKKGEKHHFYGKKHSSETRRKLSEAQKGAKNHQFGKTRSVEHRRKLSEALKGKPHSAERRRKRMHPDYIPARDYFFSLPPNIPLREKRKLLYTNFPSVTQKTIRNWLNKWLSTA